MVGPLKRCIPECHDAVADELVDGSSFFRYRARYFLEIGRDLDQKVIRRESLGVAGEILQVGKKHSKDSRLDAQGQRNARLDELADDVKRNEGGERFQRRPQQRSRGLQPRDLPDIGWPRFGAIIYFTYIIASHRGLPNVLVIMIALIALYGFVTARTTIGRQIYAVGGNEKAAKLSGIKTERLTFLAFVNMGVLAALAGLVFAARLNTATPKAGAGFELDVIAACFIGGASAYGGVGRVAGAVIGALIMGVMNNGMSILGIGIDYQQVIKGLVLLGAVCLDVYNQRH